MAGPLMRAGEIDFVVVGADRIAANGDTANKIGTYTVAVLAHEHKIPFYVAAPLSTIDLATPDGDQHSDRGARPAARSRTSARRGSRRRARTIRNPAFDVTPHRYITGIITEKGIVRPPYTRVAASAPSKPSRSSRRRERCSPSRRRATRPPRPSSRDRRSGASLADPLERRRVAGGDPPRVGRRRAGARVAPARPRHLRRRRSARWRRRGATGADVDAVAVTQGPGLVGSLLVGVAFAKALAWARRPAGRPRPSPRRPHRVAGPRTRRAAAAGCRPRRLGRAHQPVSRAGAGRLPAGRPDARRCGGGGVRQGGEAAGARLSGRSGDRPARARRDATIAFDLPTRGSPMRIATRRARPDRDLLPAEVARRTDFSFCGLKTAVLRLVQRACRRAGRRADGRWPARRRRSPTSAPASSASSSKRCSTGRSRRRAGSARAASASPAACRPTAACAPTPKRAARARAAGLRAAAGASTDNAAMIARRRPPRGFERGEHVARSTSTCGRRLRARHAERVDSRLRDLGPMTVRHSPTISGSRRRQRQEFVRITDEVAAIVKKSGVDEGMALVSAMHITAGVYVNDWEDGLIDDFQVWLEKLAPAGLAVPASPDRRRQRRRAPEAHDHGAPGDRADHRRHARSRAVGAGLLRRVRRPAPQARRRESDGELRLGARVGSETW